MKMHSYTIIAPDLPEPLYLAASAIVLFYISRGSALRCWKRKFSPPPDFSPAEREEKTTLAAHSVAPQRLANPVQLFPATTPQPSDNGAHSAASTANVPNEKLPSSPLRLRVMRGPLALAERTKVLSEYNRLTGNRVAVQEFRRWTELSPSGPAFHALLETPEGRIAAHCALVPFPLQGPQGSITVAKEQYLFWSDEYRPESLRDLPGSEKSPAALVLEQLYARASQQGWSPVLACNPPQPAPIHDALGCRPVELPVCDCFFVLHPARAWQVMRHFPPSKRIELSALAARSAVYGWCVSPFQHSHRFVRRSRIADTISSSNGHPPHSFSLSDDPAFLIWRYPESCYSRLLVDDGRAGYAIVMKGSPFTFLRVYQFRTPSIHSLFALSEKLVREARGTGALGVRWSIYGDGPEQSGMISELRKRMFFCQRRNRRVLISPSGAELLSSANWDLCDSLFTS